jgi:hypothetical protein
MDPFLEDPEIYPDFHDGFITYLRESIQLLLPPPYFAPLGRRTWIEVSERFVGPDVLVARPGTATPEIDAGPAVAVASAPRTQPLVVHVPHDERREPFVEIYVGRGSDRRLVTSIELLSPSNKTPGEHGRDLYVRKQREILDSKVHLVEIDLLRAGEHTTAVPRRRLAKAVGDFEYHVSIHRFDDWEDFLVYTIRLNGPLPEIAIPLLPGDPPVHIDLQAVFQRTYDTGPYRREINYRAAPPGPPLAAEWQSWLRELLP